MFPTEIWEKILQNVEAISLIRLRTVNSTWNTIITKYLQESDAWYKQCVHDIPQKYWFILLENSFHLFSLQKLENTNNKYERYKYKIWITMYKAWLKWLNVQNLNILTINEFNPIPEHRQSERITCCDILGELLAVGSTEGYIRIFNLISNKLVFRIDQYEQVQNIKLCVQGKDYEKIIVITTSISDKTRVWNIKTYERNLIHSHNDVICAGYGYYCLTSAQDKVIIYDTRNNSYPIQFFKPLIYYKNRRNLNSSHDGKYVNMIINKYQLCFWSDDGFYREFDMRQIFQQPTLLMVSREIDYIGVPKNQKVRNYFLFNPYVIFCITELGHLGISIYKSQWKIYNLFPFLEGAVTAIFFYIRVLVIGLDSGDVYLFSLENELALKTINFKTKKSKKIHVASEPIVSINIIEISSDQRLIVATKRTIYNIELKHTVN